ncbi:MAG TPA: rRNA maturation RNase YbeY [Syntrophorhabdaceae bacterium]|nr:rRNA maturation RNase YbeY [Syntrophorhabdaceae bacterium]HOL04658.1 rRNA maturation RNase YbeY [Syntrophorhabdaceae bacterium]HPP41087.1 rRNA maturation RNase YbeY [Syntrophorhabdaceae bacterium]HQK46019.1 rRNA maturation RNase YbeY [Syntrophorhabdaceae bacterium]
MVLIKDSQRLLKINKRQIKRLIEELLIYSGLQDRHISLLFTDNKGIKKLNHEYFGRDWSTNVISFSYLEDEGLKEEEVIGDIIISLERAKEEAEHAQCDFYERLMALIIHGLLHIKGLDHEKGGNEARRMRYHEKRLLSLITAHEGYKRLITDYVDKVRM